MNVSFNSLNTMVEGSPYLVGADAAEEVLTKSSNGGESEPRSDAREYHSLYFTQGYGFQFLLSFARFYCFTFRQSLILFSLPFLATVVVYKWHFREENSYSKL